MERAERTAGPHLWRRLRLLRRPSSIGRLTLIVLLVWTLLATRGDGGEQPAVELGAGERIDIAPALRRQQAIAEDREIVETMVRSHRPSADSGWCKTLADAIYDESVAANIDPLLVASIVAVESSFQTRVVSTVGAVGLMQLRPFVAEAVAAEIDVEWTGSETLHEPHLNVRLGVEYYQALLNRFDSDRRVALTAYNFGPTRVSGWIRAGTYDGSRYASRVLATYEAARRLKRPGERG